jgi:hypothetical protein
MTEARTTGEQRTTTDSDRSEVELPAAAAAGNDQPRPANRRSRAVVGPVLAAIAAVHLAFTPLFQPAFGDLLRTRLTGAAPSASLAQTALQESGFWYVITGVGLLPLAGLAWWLERRGLRLPRALGVFFLLLACCGLLLGPVTGFWLFLVPGLAVLLRSRSAG